MDPDQAGQAAEGPGQQQEPAAALAAGAPAQAAAAQPPVLAAAQQPDAEEVEEPEGDSSEEGWEENEEGERGPDSLLQLVQRQVLRGIETAASGMQPPFAVGGSLGRGVSVALAVTQPPAAGAAEGSAATASQPAVAVRFPEGGQAALQALEAVCQPASFGVGTEAGGRVGSAAMCHGDSAARALLASSHACQAMPGRDQQPGTVVRQTWPRQHAPAAQLAAPPRAALCSVGRRLPAGPGCARRPPLPTV